MRPPLTIAVVQPESVARDIERNALLHADAIRAADARVVVFPELSLSGYELDAPTVAPVDGRLRPMIAACADAGALALAGAPVAGEDVGISIGMLAVDATGARIAYRKMSLGGAEPACFTAGTRPTVSRGGWLAPGACDLSRHRGLSSCLGQAAVGMDVYVAGVLEFAGDFAVPDERARRIAADQHVWVAIASFAGSTGGGYDHAAGGSGIWAPDGSVVARAGPEVGAIVRATLPPPGPE